MIEKLKHDAQETEGAKYFVNGWNECHKRFVKGKR